MSENQNNNNNNFLTEFGDFQEAQRQKVDDSDMNAEFSTSVLKKNDDSMEVDVNPFSVDMSFNFDQFNEKSAENCQFNSHSLKEKTIIAAFSQVVNLGLGNHLRHAFLGHSVEKYETDVNLSAQYVKEVLSSGRAIMTLLSQLVSINKKDSLKLLDNLEKGLYSKANIHKFMQSRNVASTVDFHLFNFLPMNSLLNAGIIQVQGGSLVRDTEKSQTIDSIVDGFYKMFTYKNFGVDDFSLFNLIDDVSVDNSKNFIDNSQYAWLSMFVSDHLVLKTPAANQKKEDADKNGKYPCRISLKDTLVKVVGTSYECGPFNIDLPDDLDVQSKSIISFFFNFFGDYQSKFKSTNDLIDAGAKVRVLSPLQTILEGIRLVQYDDVNIRKYFDNILGLLFSGNTPMSLFLHPTLKQFLIDLSKDDFFKRDDYIPKAFKIVERNQSDIRFFFKLLAVKQVIVSYCLKHISYDEKRSTFQNLTSFMGHLSSIENGQVSRTQMMGGSDVIPLIHFLVNEEKKNSDEIIYIGSSRNSVDISKLGVSFKDKNDFKQKSNTGNNMIVFLEKFTSLTNDKKIVILDQKSMNAVNIEGFVCDMLNDGKEVIVIDSYRRENTLLMSTKHSVYKKCLVSFKGMNHDSFVSFFTQRGFKHESTENAKLYFNKKQEFEHVKDFKLTFKKYFQTLMLSSVDGDYLRSQLRSFILKSVSARQQVDDSAFNKDDDKVLIEDINFSAYRNFN